MVYWIITADVENPKGEAEGIGHLPQRPGWIARYAMNQITPEILKALPYRFRVLDSDGIPYYLGFASEEGFAPKDWAMANAGCTAIEYANGDQWEML